MNVRRQPLSVAILDDRRLFADALGRVLVLAGCDVHRIGVADAGVPLAGAVPDLLRARPQVALLDLDVGPHREVQPLIPAAVAAGIRAIALTGTPSPVRWGECLDLGARAVLAKSQHLDEVLIVVRRVQRDLPVLDALRRDALIARWRIWQREQEVLRGRLATLTPREAEILGHLVLGQGVAEICLLDGISEATARTHVRSVLAKLGVASQVGAVGAARRAGWQPGAG